MLKKKERDGYVYVSPKTKREYHLLEGMAVGDTLTSDILFIFDYQNDIDEDAEGKLVGWFFGAQYFKDKDTEKFISDIVDKYEEEAQLKSNSKTSFTDDELYMLSDGMLALIRNINEAAKLVSDSNAINTLKETNQKYRELNTKICMMLK